MCEKLIDYSQLQIGCNAVSWAPAVHPGSLFDVSSVKYFSIT